MINDLPRKTLNVDKPNLLPFYTLKEHDDAILKLALFKNSVSFDVTGQTVKLGIKRPNGTFVNIELLEGDNPFTIVSNNLDIKLKNSALAIPGLLECDLELVDVNGKMTTASFFITVNKKVVGDNNIQATNEIAILDKVKLEEEKREIEENLRVQNETNRTNTENTRVSNENTRIENENLRKSNEEERKVNETARQNVYKEIQDTRKDYNGKTHDNLNERLKSDMGYVNDRFNKASLLEYDNNYITANKSYDGITRDLKIKGNTTQNLYDNINHNAVLTNKKIDSYYTDVTLCDTSILKVNTTYTIIYNLEVIEDTSNGSFGGVGIGLANQKNSFQKDITTKNITTSLGKQQIKVTFNISDFENYSYLSIRPLRRSTVPTSGQYIIVNVNNYIILEGDYTNKSIPAYFEGIKSAGEEGAIQISSVGKNLINLNDITFLKGGATELVEKNSNSIIVRSNVAQLFGHMYGIFKPGVFKSNTNYRLSFKSESNRVDVGKCIAIRIFKDNNFNSVVAHNNSKNTFSFTTPASIKGLGVAFYTNISDNTEIAYTLNKYYDIQIEEVAQINDPETTYEPYKEDKINITLNDPLRRVPSGARDILDLENKKVIKAVGKIVLNGNETWTRITSFDTSGATVFRMENIFDGVIGSNTVLSDKFQTKSVTFTTEDYECISCSTNGTKSALYIKIFLNKLSTVDSLGFKAWLQVNPVTVYYQLETPIETAIDIINNLRTYDGTTNIFTQGSLIEPNIYCKVPSDVITALDTRQSTVKGKAFSSADARLEEIEQDIKNIVTQEAWIIPTLLNGATGGTGTIEPIAYRKNKLGKIEFKGELTTVATGEIFNLPSGYYNPSKNIRIPIVTLGGKSTSIQIGTTGKVSFYAIDVFSLNNIGFYIN